jgi:hypothetical protein
LGKLIPSLEADLERRDYSLAVRKKRELKDRGQDFLGDDDDLVDGMESKEGDDSSIPDPAAWMMFRRYMGWQSEDVLGRQRDCIVYRDWHIFRYLLARGLLSSYSF